MTIIPLALVYDAKHQSRALQRDAVSAIAQSMARIGLRMPITVRPTTRIRDGRPADVWEVVTGRHRVEAAHSLGWTEIEAVVRECDETEARLWEIAENLHRAELTVAERAEHIAEWVRLTGDKESAQVAPKLPQKGVGRGVGGGRPESGINAAVRELGIDRTEAQRALKIAGLSDEAKEAARETGRDNNQAALLKAAKVPAAEQAAVIREYAPAPRVKPAPAPLTELETEEQWMSAIMRVWNRAAPQWRERFLETVDKPVFERTRAGAAA